MNTIVWNQIIVKQDLGPYSYTHFNMSIPVQK